MATQEHTYTFELDYDKVDYTVDTVLKKVTDWQKNFWGERVSYLISDEITWILWIFKIKSKKLKIYITGWRHAKVLCNMLWMKFNPNKYKYQKDLFQLDL